MKDRMSAPPSTGLEQAVFRAASEKEKLLNFQMLLKSDYNLQKENCIRHIFESLGFKVLITIMQKVS